MSVEGIQIIPIDSFYVEYSPLKSTQILDIYSVNCFDKDLSKVNMYLLKSRENYLEFLRYYNEPALYGELSNYLKNLSENLFILEKLKKYEKETISNFEKFSYYFALVLKEYGEIIDQDYKTLCWIGADQPDFPGVLREKYVEYKKLIDYLKQRNTIKDYENVKKLEVYQKCFLIALSYMEKSADIVDRLIAYKYLFKSIGDICKNHQEINKIVNRYKEEISQKKIELSNLYNNYYKNFRNIEPKCYSYNYNYFNNISSIKPGNLNTPKEMCDEIYNLLNSINFDLYNSKQEDYIYYNYLKLRNIEKKLEKVKTLLDQVEYDIYNLNKTCFETLREYIDNEEDNIIKKFLIDKYYKGDYNSCIEAINFYNNLKNSECDIYNFEKEILGLDSVGYDVSYEIKILNECKEDILSYSICCSELKSRVLEKYKLFKKDLEKLRHKYEYLNNLYSKVFGYKISLYFKDEFEEYLLLKEKINYLESFLKNQIIEHLKNNTFISYKFDEIPKCGEYTNFKVVINVNNDLGFEINDISYNVSDAFGVYIIKGKINKGLNVFVFDKYGKVSFCGINLISTKGNNWLTYKTYIINVSSLSEKTKYCFNDEVVLRTNTSCVDLFNGKNLVETVSKTRFKYDLFNNFGYLYVYEPYTLFYLYTNISEPINSSIHYFYKDNKVVFVFYNLTNSIKFYWKYVNTSVVNISNEINSVNESINLFLLDKDITKTNFSFVVDRYKQYLLDEIENKAKKYKYYPDVFEKLIELKNEIKNKKNLSIEDLYRYQKKIYEIKHTPKNYDDQINFICSIDDCNNLRKQYEEYKKGKLSDEIFKTVLNEEINKNKQKLIKDYEGLHITYNLRKLKLCFDENSTIYQEYLKEYNDLKNKFFENLKENSTDSVIYLNKLQNLNAKIESLIEIQKQKAKYMIDRLKLLLKNIENPDDYKEQINKIVDLYNSGKYNDVILTIKSLIKDLDLKPEQQKEFDFNSLFVIVVFILLVIGLVFIFNKNEKKKIIIKRSEDV